MTLIVVGLLLVMLSFALLKSKVAGRLSFGIGIVTLGFGLMLYIR